MKKGKQQSVKSSSARTASRSKGTQRGSTGTRARASSANRGTSKKRKKTASLSSSSTKRSSAKRSVARTVKQRKGTKPRVRVASPSANARRKKTAPIQSKRRKSSPPRVRVASSRVPKKGKLRTSFPPKGRISPVFAKYVEPVTEERRVTYAQVTVDLSYTGEEVGEDEIDPDDYETEEEYLRAVKRARKKSRRTFPLKLGYYTKKSVAKLDSEDIEEILRSKYGDRATLKGVEGFLQRKPDSERRGVYFTKKRAKRAARAAQIRETKKERSRAFQAERRGKAFEKAASSLTEENRRLKAELNALKSLKKSSSHRAPRNRRGTRR